VKWRHYNRVKRSVGRPRKLRQGDGVPPGPTAANLAEQFSLYLGRHYNRVKRDGPGRPEKCPQVEDKSGRTAANLAKQYGVSPRTVERAGEFAEAVDADLGGLGGRRGGGAPSWWTARSARRADRTRDRWPPSRPRMGEFAPGTSASWRGRGTIGERARHRFSRANETGYPKRNAMRS
jgi:hypothetical protein